MKIFLFAPKTALFFGTCRRAVLLLLLLPALAWAQAGPPAVCPAVAPDPVPANAAVWGTGTPASCTPMALQALLNAGGPIRCNGGTQPFTVVLSAPLVVPNRDVLLDGGNLLTLSGGGVARIFDKLAAPSAALDSRLALQRLTLRDGRAPNQPGGAAPDVLGGAAIRGRAYGRLKVVDVVFEGNEGPLSQSDACGAVHTIVYQSVVFGGCTFRRNRAANGGAVGTIGSAEQFVNCVFEDNAATGTGGTFALGGSGGAVYVDGVDQNGVTNTLSLCGCAFRRNTAGYQAGAVNIIFYDTKGSSGTLDRLTFEDNSAAVDKGGALYLTGTGNQSNPYGGGTINKNSSLTVAAGNVQWPENYAAQFGPQREDWLTPAVRVADAQLQPLANNGGPTLTQALPATSPARDWGTAPAAPATDQRGAPRLGAPDAGAYEFGTAAPLAAVVAAQAPSLQLVPNPATGAVRLVGALPAAPVQLCDALGRAVRQFPAGTGVLDLRGLPAGMYLVRVPGQRAVRLLNQE